MVTGTHLRRPGRKEGGALQEERMNRVRVAMAVLSAIALVTVAVPFADAGRGMGFGEGVSACRTISNGVNPPQVVNLEVETIPTTVAGAPVGPPVLLCELSTIGETANASSRVPETQSVANPTNIVCYPINAPDSPKQTVTITDPFTNATGSSQQATLGGVYLLCVRAIVDFTP
jgi:hypothetical protein